MLPALLKVLEKNENYAGSKFAACSLLFLEISVLEFFRFQDGNLPLFKMRNFSF